MGGGTSRQQSREQSRQPSKANLAAAEVKYVFSFHHNPPVALELKKVKHAPLKRSDSAPNLLSSNTIFCPYVDVVVGKEGASGSRVQRSVVKNKNSQVVATVERFTDYYQFNPQIPWLIKNAYFNEPDLKDFVVTRTIGKGKTGTTRMAKTSTGKYMVIKTIPKEYIFSKNEERHIVNEREAMYELNSPFCAKLFAEFEDKSNVYFAMEFVPGGELYRCLELQNALPNDDAKFYLTEIFAALEHMHAVGYVYRDLKPENVVIDDEGHIKLVDFGSAIRSDTHASGKLYTMCCAVPYMSPEQMNQKTSGGYTKVVDWWAFGILAYELMVGHTPFCANKETEYEILLKILKNKIKFPSSFNATSRKLIADLLQWDLKVRVSTPQQIKTHEYFDDVKHWKHVTDKRLVPPFVPEFCREGDSHYFILNDEKSSKHWKTNNLETLVKMF